MTDIKQKALALVNAEQAKSGCLPIGAYHGPCMKALCRAIEQHEAFKLEVSDAVEWVVNSTYMPAPSEHKLRRFIIAKTDPLVEALEECGLVFDDGATGLSEQLRAALEARGLAIVSKEKS